MVSDFLAAIWSGHFSPEARVWSAIFPGLLLLAVFVACALAYTVRTLAYGRFHDEEMDGRGLGALTGARVRHFFAWMMRPLWRGLAAVDVPPTAITTLSVAFALAAGVAAAAGRFSLAGWVYLTAGALDFLDGRVARVTGRVSPGGAALDSVLDRYCESALLVGLGWYYRASWVLLAVLLALTGSLLVPYVRARGEALGAKVSNVGALQRPERIALLGTAVALAPIPEAWLAPGDPHPPHRLAILGLLVLGVAAHWTALKRLVHLLRALGGTRTATARSMPRPLVVSGIATVIDFSVMRLLSDELGWSLPAATVVGCLTGGLVSFLLWQRWLSAQEPGHLRGQVARFVFVWTTSALLNAGGVALLLLVPVLAPSLDWLLTRAVVFACWNTPLHRAWVFGRTRRRTAGELERPSKAGPDVRGKGAAGVS